VNDDLRKKYLQTGSAVLKDGASSAAAAAAAALPIREAPKHEYQPRVSAPRGAGNGERARGGIGGQSDSGGEKAGTAGKGLSSWLWRFVKLALVLLALFVALVVYFAIKDPGQPAQPTNWSKSTAAEAQEAPPASTGPQAVSSGDQPHAADEPPAAPAPAPTSATEVASAPAVTATQAATDTGMLETHTSLAPAVTTLPSAPPASRTPLATAWLGDFLIQHASDTDCGALKDLYCKADLVRQAAREAYNDSVRCDQQQSTAPQCGGTGLDFIERRYREVEIQTLTRQKNNLQSFLLSASKSGIANGNVMLLAEPCEREAVNNGMRGADYFDYSKHTCLPRALETYLRPKKEALQRVNTRLQELDAADTPITDGPAARRCGWIENDMPSSLTLRDRDGTWQIIGASKSGTIANPDGFDQMPPTSKGVSCGCLTIETSKQAMQVVKVLGGSLKPVSACQTDQSLQ
jgi:Protein of unknown function (DUF4087)